MGYECECEARRGAASCRGRAHFESDRVTFRGDFRVTLLAAELTTVRSDGGWLHLATASDTLDLEIGARADALAERLRNPPSRLDKLGVKAGQSAAVEGAVDPAFQDELRAASGSVRLDLRPDLDILFYAATAAADLDRLASLKALLRPAGALWVVSPKGRGAPLKDTDVMREARAAGLVDTKVVSFSPTHTALKLVIPAGSRRASS